MKSRDIIEAENPKSVLRAAAAPRVTKQNKTTVEFTDGRGNTIAIDWTFGVPTIGWLRYELSDDHTAENAQAGRGLLKQAYDFLRAKGEYRAKVATRTTRANHGIWDVAWDNDSEIGQLIYDVEPEVVTSLDGMVRHVTLENVLSLDQRGGLNLDARPKAPNSIWTQRREQPYHRVRTLSNGKALEIYVAYKKDKAPNKLLQLVKKYGPKVGKTAALAADDLAAALQGQGITVVVPMPSSQPLARRLARLLAHRLGVPFEDRITKASSVAHVPIPRRKVAAHRIISVGGLTPGQTVLVVDDYVVTSASMMAAAVHLYSAGARKVVGAALAI